MSSLLLFFIKPSMLLCQRSTYSSSPKLFLCVSVRFRSSKATEESTVIVAFRADEEEDDDEEEERKREIKGKEQKNEEMKG